jgi:hypothetical protein
VLLIWNVKFFKNLLVITISGILTTSPIDTERRSQLYQDELENLKSLLVSSSLAGCLSSPVDTKEVSMSI